MLSRVPVQSVTDSPAPYVCPEQRHPDNRCTTVCVCGGPIGTEILYVGGSGYRAFTYCINGREREQDLADAWAVWQDAEASARLVRERGGRPEDLEDAIAKAHAAEADWLLSHRALRFLHGGLAA